MRNENGNLMMTRQQVILLTAMARDYSDSLEKVLQNFNYNTHVKKAAVSKEVDETTTEFVNRLTDFFTTLDTKPDDVKAAK